MEITREDGILTFKLEGEISFLNINPLKDDILKNLLPEDKKIILNMEKIDFMDSAGLGMVLCFTKEMKSRGGELIVEHPQLGVQKIFQMSRMEKVMKIIYTEEETTGDWSEFDDNGL